MWILDSEGDFLEGEFMSSAVFITCVMLAVILMGGVGKRVWLRPGKKYLFGRVKTEGGKCCFAWEC